MRVLVIASETPPVVSGVSRSVSQLIEGLANRGHDVEVLSANDAPYLTRGDFRVSGLASRLPSIWRDLRRFDVVNIHGPAPTISDPFLAGIGMISRHRRPGLVYTHHFTVEMSQRWIQPALRLYDVLTRRLARVADHVVVTSKSYADILSTGCRADRVSVIPWGIEFERFACRRYETFDGRRDLRVLYVGQLREYKGAHVAVDAIANTDGVALTIVGNGPSEPAVRRRIEASGATNVDFRGSVSDDDLVSEYARNDVIVLPSINRLEAFGIVLLEGMASGCVPVASDLPGVRDMASDCGMLAAPGDPSDLAWAVKLLASRPDILAGLQQRAMEKATQYSMETTIDHHESLFERVASGPSGPRTAP